MAKDKIIEAEAKTEVVYRYEGVSYHLTDAGKKSGDKEVDQVLSWTANRRKKVG